MRIINMFREKFPKPVQAIWVGVAAAFVIAMLLMDSAVNDTAAKLITSYSGTLALAVGVGFLARSTKAMMNGRKPFALLIGSAGLGILGVGIIEILVAGSTDFSKDLAAMVAAGILGFFNDED